MNGGPTEPADGRGPGGLTAGGRFAGLDIEAEVGRGGMGVIYRARDPELDRVRALTTSSGSASAGSHARPPRSSTRT